MLIEWKRKIQPHPVCSRSSFTLDRYIFQRLDNFFNASRFDRLNTSRRDPMDASKTYKARTLRFERDIAIRIRYYRLAYYLGISSRYYRYYSERQSFERKTRTNLLAIGVGREPRRDKGEGGADNRNEDKSQDVERVVSVGGRRGENFGEGKERKCVDGMR